MNVILHRTCLLISRPRYDEKLVAWHAYASISRNGGEFLYHQLILDEIFQTEKEALEFGYAAARTWSDHESDRPRSRMH